MLKIPTDILMFLLMTMAVVGWGRGETKAPSFENYRGRLDFNSQYPFPTLGKICGNPHGIATPIPTEIRMGISASK